MKTWKQTAIDSAAKKIRQIGEFELLGWPPDCLGSFYQPERPFTNQTDTFPENELHKDE